ncbi:MAG: ATP phosphoribosyltransferase regulatory subunit [Mariprofundales bacterium]
MTTMPLAIKSHAVAGLDDLFGMRAKNVRRIQQQLLDLFESADYEEIIPPLLTRPEVIFSQTSAALMAQTLVFNDPHTAGIVAIRPDMTPQIARIAATHKRHQQLLRLCYSGLTLTARPERESGTRQQLQTGIELLGLTGTDADHEVLALAIKALQISKIDAPVLLLGHIGLLRSLLGSSINDNEFESWLNVLKRRSPDDLRSHTGFEQLSLAYKQALIHIVCGDASSSWLREHANKYGQGFANAANELLNIEDKLKQGLQAEESSKVEVRIDTALMPHCTYHSGMIFSAYAPNYSHVLLSGGRYDAMMRAHGRDMPAIGFSCDLLRWCK